VRDKENIKKEQERLWEKDSENKRSGKEENKKDQQSGRERMRGGERGRSRKTK
jgi:hypothetical protein